MTVVWFVLGALCGVTAALWWVCRLDATPPVPTVDTVKTVNVYDGHLWIAAPSDELAVEILITDRRKADD